MKIKIITNWAIVEGGPDPDQAPELREYNLFGDIEGKTNQITTVIQGKRGQHIITKNTEYILGFVNPEYEEAYPNAKRRLLDSAAEI